MATESNSTYDYVFDEDKVGGLFYDYLDDSSDENKMVNSVKSGFTEEVNRLDRWRLLEVEMKLLKEHYLTIVREKNQFIKEKSLFMDEKMRFVEEKSRMAEARESELRNENESLKKQLEEARELNKKLAEERNQLLKEQVEDRKRFDKEISNATKQFRLIKEKDKLTSELNNDEELFREELEEAIELSEKTAEERDQLKKEQVEDRKRFEKEMSQFTKKLDKQMKLVNEKDNQVKKLKQQLDQLKQHQQNGPPKQKFGNQVQQQQSQQQPLNRTLKEAASTSVGKQPVATFTNMTWNPQSIGSQTSANPSGYSSLSAYPYKLPEVNAIPLQTFQLPVANPMLVGNTFPYLPNGYGYPTVKECPPKGNDCQSNSKIDLENRLRRFVENL